MTSQPNVLIIISDEWRGQAFGFAGDPNVATPHCDQLAAESWQFRTAVSNCPVCCPIRATMLTGLYPDKHGAFTNDVHLDQRFSSLADCFNMAGYRTGWIGKWHVDGHGRSAYIPPERRQGFRYFEALECTHHYHDSPYYLQDDPQQRRYAGYDASAQTASAIQFMQQPSEQPFCLALSWGPPHFPYETAPQEYRDQYQADSIQLRPNVPAAVAADSRRDLAGYYAHCTALDDCTGQLLDFLKTSGLDENTIVIFTSDHGDFLGSHGFIHKQKPWDESILVPMLIRPPRSWQAPARVITQPYGHIDFLPTVCGLAAVPIPTCVQGRNLAPFLRENNELPDDPQLIASYAMFGEYDRTRNGRVYRGIRTEHYTYVCDTNGPWLLFDNSKDPYQQHNLLNQPEYDTTQKECAERLQQLLRAINDDFADHESMHQRWGWKDDAHTGTVAFAAQHGHGPSPYAAERVNDAAEKCAGSRHA